MKISTKLARVWAIVESCENDTTDIRGIFSSRAAAEGAAENLIGRWKEEGDTIAKSRLDASTTYDLRAGTDNWVKVVVSLWNVSR